MVRNLSAFEMIFRGRMLLHETEHVSCLLMSVVVKNNLFFYRSLIFILISFAT
jgi:hypothetical protein